MRASSILVLPLIVAALLVGGPTAGAAVKPPDANLRTKGDGAPLRPWTYDWTHPTNQLTACGAVVADGSPSYEPLIEVNHNRAKTRVVFFRNRRPTVRRFRAHSTLDRRGFPAGKGKPVPHRVRPRRIEGAITAWKIEFRADAARRPYVDLDVSFPLRHAGQCKEGGGALYAFGIARRRG